MSLNHILETARKLGIPVILTNDRGDAPQVIMPFEDFASMVGVSAAPVGKRPRLSKAGDEEDEEIAQALADLAREEMERKIHREPVAPAAGAEAPLTDEEIESLAAQDALMLEEKFSFEPIEEEEEKE